MENYQADFAGNGGWDSLARLSQPQNNFYGNLLMSLNEASVQRFAEEDSDVSSVMAGLGFDSRRDGASSRTGYCTSNRNQTCTKNSDWFNR